MSHNMSREISGWDRLIADSQEMLKRVEAKAQRLRANIEMAKEAKASGEPYLTQPGRQTTEPCHAV